MIAQNQATLVGRTAAGLAAAIGALALAIWAFGTPGLVSLAAPWNPMSPISALCFVFCGISLGLRSLPGGRGASAAAVAMASLALVGVGYTALHTNLGLGAIIARTLEDPYRVARALSASGSPLNTAPAFIATAAGILSLGRGRRSAFDLAGWIGLCVASFALHILFTLRMVAQVETAARMAPVSAIGFLLVGISLASSRLGPDTLAVFRRGNPIGFIALRLILAGLLVPPLVFTLQSWWILSRGETVRGGSVFFASVYAMAFLGLIIVLTRRMISLDLHRNNAELARNEMLARVQEQAANLQFEVSERTCELQESSKRLELALRSSACGVWDWDPTNGRLIWNERQCAIYGLTREQFDGRLETWAEFVHPEDRGLALSAMHHELEAADNFESRYRIVTPTGAIRHIEAHGYAHRDDRGRCLRVVGVDRDVTHLRESERALISLAERLQFALGSAGYGIWEWDCTADRLTWDDHLLEIHGIRRNEFTGTMDELWRMVHPADLNAAQRAAEDIQQGRSEYYENCFRIVRRDGSVRHVEARGFLQRSTEFRPMRVIGLARDITAEKEMGERLKVAEERWQLAIVANNDGLWDWNIETSELYFDDRWTEMIGHQPGELPHTYKEWECRVHPDDLRITETAMEAHRSGKAPFYLAEYRFRHKLGHWVWILDRGKIVSRDGRGRPLRMVGTHNDISERKELERRLRHFEEMALQMGTLAQIGPWDWQLGADKLTWSPELFRIHHADLGFEPTFEGMLSFYDPEGQATLREAFDRAIRSGSPFDLELPLAASDGRRLWVRFLGKAELKDGVASHLYGSIQNITEIRESESARRQLETQLFQAQKMETLGTLAGGIAHDFNNLLTGILGYQELALDGLPMDSPARECLDAAKDVSMRARRLVEQILTMSRSPSTELGPVDLAFVIDEAACFLRTTVPQNITVQKTIAPDCGRALAEASQIHQVLLNLGQNAAHAMPEGGAIQISLSPAAIDGAKAAELGITATGAYLRLAISDNGHGMDAETQKRIFDPFFTTKGVGKGTGLGLSVVHGIVRAHRGAITVESAPGRGSTFSIYLKCAAGVEQQRTHDDKPTPHGSGELVCIVDDEDFVLSCVSKAVDNLGYRSVTFDSPERCLEALQGEHRNCSLLVTDQTMPGMNGTEVAERARSFAPTLPIIIMSGYFSKISPTVLDRVARVSLVSKPFTSGELASAVHRALHPDS